MDGGWGGWGHGSMDGRTKCHLRSIDLDATMVQRTHLDGFPAQVLQFDTTHPPTQHGPSLSVIVTAVPRANRACRAIVRASSFSRTRSGETMWQRRQMTMPVPTRSDIDSVQMKLAEAVLSEGGGGGRGGGDAVSQPPNVTQARSDLQT